MSVLILAQPGDLHGQAVQERLDALGVRVNFWHYEKLLSGSLVASLGDDCLEIAMDSGSNSDTTLDLMAMTAIWFRRPGTLKVPFLPPESWMTAAVEWEAGRALSSLWRCLPALFVNEPKAQHDALHKLWQLERAKRVGMRIPETLVTNSPDRVREFYDRVGGDLVYKLIDEQTWRFFPVHEGPSGLPTMPVRAADLEHIDQTRLGLHLFQRRVDKIADIRVTAVGQKLFAVRIESQLGAGKLDFRLDYSVPMTRMDLPDEVSKCCLDYMLAFGLEYAAFDFCLTRDQTFIFLEANPAGQFLWMEEGLDIPISQELALLLAGRSLPLGQLKSKSAR